MGSINVVCFFDRLVFIVDELLCFYRLYIFYVGSVNYIKI